MVYHTLPNCNILCNNKPWYLSLTLPLTTPYTFPYHDMPSSLPPTRATTSETPSLPRSTSGHTSTIIPSTQRPTPATNDVHCQDRAYKNHIFTRWTFISCFFWGFSLNQKKEVENLIEQATDRVADIDLSGRVCVWAYTIHMCVCVCGSVNVQECASGSVQ